MIESNKINEDNISKTSFAVRIKGSSEISALTLSDCLKSLNTILTEDITLPNYEQSATFNVNAIESGSFEIEFSFAVTTLYSLLTQNPEIFKSAAKNIMDTFVSMLKKLKEECKTQQIEGSDNMNLNIGDYNNIIISGGVNVNINAPGFISRVGDLSQALLDDDRDGLEIIEDGKEVFDADKDILERFASLSAPLSENKKVSDESALNLRVKKPDLTMNSKWQFYHEGKVINATIEDEDFKESVMSGKKLISFGYNSKIPVIMRTEYEIDESGEPIPNSVQYFIVKVTGDVINSDEQKSFF